MFSYLCSPLANSAGGFSVLKHVPKRERRWDLDLVALEIVAKLLRCHDHTTYAIFSISEYNSFEPLRASETKYMGTYVNAPSTVRSSTRVALTAAPDVAMYKSNSAFSEGLDMIAKFSMYV